ASAPCPDGRSVGAGATQAAPPIGRRDRPARSRGPTGDALARGTSQAGRAALSGPRQTLSREAWIAAARKVLERRGIAEVKIDRLARQFKVTRGSFYFHFA